MTQAEISFDGKDNRGMRNFFIKNERDGTTLETPVCGRRIEDAQAVFAYVYPEARILGARPAKPGEDFREKCTA